MQEQSVKLLIDLLKIYSPSGKEEEISDYLIEVMNEFGIKSYKDEVGNVIGIHGKESPIVLFCGHIDTVPGFIPVEIKESKIYGRGAVDAKSSFASMLFAMKLLKDEEFKGKIIIAGLVDEEGKGLGIKHFIKNNSFKFDYAIFGEPSGIQNITIGYKGSLHLSINCKTLTGHSASPWLFENAIEKSIEIWNLIKNFHLPNEKIGSIFYSITSCLTKLYGGGKPGLVPDECEMEIDLRFPPPFSPGFIFEEIKKIVEKYNEENKKVSINISLNDFCPAFESEKNSLLVKSLAWAIRNVTSKPATLVKKTGTADMNILGQVLKIPTVAYGPGDSKLDHSPNEHITIDEYLASIQVYKRAIIKLLELHSKVS
ncbi:MAG: M20/M25/M40 family metallo-hydrolase [Candidatus Bathyarchaeia archaeon]